MSKLGKILLWVALAGAIVAVGAGVALVLQYNDTKTNLAQTQQAKTAADQATAKAKAETAAVTTAKADSDSKLATATSKIDDLNTQLDAAKKQSADATTAVQTANDNAKRPTMPWPPSRTRSVTRPRPIQNRQDQGRVGPGGGPK